MMSAASGCDRTPRPPSIGRNVHLLGLLVGPTPLDTPSAGLRYRFTRRVLYFLPMDKTVGDYRIFVGAFATGELAERIQAVRLRHDAKTARTPALHRRCKCYCATRDDSRHVLAQRAGLARQ